MVLASMLEEGYHTQRSRPANERKTPPSLKCQYWAYLENVVILIHLADFKRGILACWRWWLRSEALMKVKKVIWNLKKQKISFSYPCQQFQGELHSIYGDDIMLDWNHVEDQGQMGEQRRNVQKNFWEFKKRICTRQRGVQGSKGVSKRRIIGGWWHIPVAIGINAHLLAVELMDVSTSVIA